MAEVVGFVEIVEDREARFFVQESV